MRITKRIEEYIRQQVENKAYSAPSYQVLETASKEAKKRYWDGMNDIQQAAREAYTKMLTEMGLENAEGYRLTVSGFYSAEDNMPAVIAFRKACNEARTQISKIVDEILITMEMGGDKDTLNQLLEAVHFD